MVKREKNSNSLQFLGAALTVVGSFLPWERSGGFFDPFVFGIRADVESFKYWVRGTHVFPVYDYGGGLVILLTSVIVLLVYRPPRRIKNPILWGLIVSVVLMASSMYFLARGLVHVYEFSSSVEAPSLQAGLIGVMLGSALLLWRAILGYRQAANAEIKGAA